jgi:hypothetical protein
MFSFRKEQDTPLREALADLKTEVRDLRAAQEALEADLEWLSGQVKTLRGKVTGGIRGEKAPRMPQDAPNGGGPPPYGTPEWFEATHPGRR